jgi:trehalose 6-phosphate phosphatase
MASAGGYPPADLLRGASLFLDFDGTLVEIAERPDGVAVGDRLQRLLEALGAKLDGRLALVSGRPSGQLRALVGLTEFVIAGSHGMEFCHGDGTVESARRPEALAEVQAEFARLAQACEGLLIEDKPLGFALHYRLRPDAAERCNTAAAELARRHGLHLQTGKMMIEVRAAGGDKGSAIRRLMELPAMRGTRPVFIGDDDTDEPGFEAAAALGGAGILVGPVRETAARYRLAGPGAVLDWLEAAA